MNKDLGRLTRVSLREAWESEAGHFTPWLAQEENIKLRFVDEARRVEAKKTKTRAGNENLK